MNLRKQIGAEFLRVREKKKLTRQQVAAAAKMDVNDYRKYEIGERNISADTIERLAAAVKKKAELKLK